MILTSENVGDYVTRRSWAPLAVVQVTAVGKRKILVDRQGYEDVFANDGEFLIVYKKGGEWEEMPTAVKRASK